MNCKYIQFYNFLWIIDQNDESDDESLGGWVNWFCEIEGHEFCRSRWGFYTRFF